MSVLYHSIGCSLFSYLSPRVQDYEHIFQVGSRTNRGLIPGYLQFTRGYRECRVHFIPFRKLQNMWAVAGSDEFFFPFFSLTLFLGIPRKSLPAPAADMSTHQNVFRKFWSGQAQTLPGSPRLDYQPLFGKMSPHSSPERAAGRVRFPLLV